MNIIKTAIDGLLIWEPKVFEDNRGYSFEVWKKAVLKRLHLHSTLQYRLQKPFFADITPWHE